MNPYKSRIYIYISYISYISYIYIYIHTYHIYVIYICMVLLCLVKTRIFAGKSHFFQWLKQTCFFLRSPAHQPQAWRWSLRKTINNTIVSLDWIKGKFTGNHGFYH